MLMVNLLCALQGDSKRGVEGGSSMGSEDSDLERKRREAEALLQSVGITPDIPHGKCTVLLPSYLCPISHLFLLICLMYFQCLQKSF